MIPDFYRRLLESQARDGEKGKDLSHVLALKCMVHSRRRFLRLFESSCQNPYELYIKALQLEIYGTAETESQLRTLSLDELRRLYHRLGNSSIVARKSFRREILAQRGISLPQVILPPSVQQHFPGLQAELNRTDAELSRIVSYTAAMAQTYEERCVAKELALEFIERQLNDQMFGHPIREKLRDWISFRETPSGNLWEEVCFCSGNEVTKKDYKFVYPSCFALDQRSQMELEHYAKADFCLDWLALGLLNRWSLRHSSLLASSAQIQLLEKIGQCQHVRNVIGLHSSDPILPLLHADLLECLMEDGLAALAPWTNEYDSLITSLRAYLDRDPAGALYVLAQGLTTTGKIQMDPQALIHALQLRATSRPDLQLQISPAMFKPPLSPSSS